MEPALDADARATHTAERQVAPAPHPAARGALDALCGAVPRDPHVGAETLQAADAAQAVPRLAERAREEEWSPERFLEAVLSAEVSSRESHGGENRLKAARFPARKTLEEFDFTFQRTVKKQVVEHLGQLDFLHGKENVVLLGPPDLGSHCTFRLTR
mgnify:CR=1 FL=1